MLFKNCLVRGAVGSEPFSTKNWEEMGRVAVAPAATLLICLGMADPRGVRCNRPETKNWECGASKWLLKRLIWAVDNQDGSNNVRG